MAKFQLSLLIHAHQPVGNFDDVIERAYQRSYLPFVETLARHPSIHMGLHYSGVLLEWLEHARPEYFELLRTLVNRGQIEIVGGGFAPTHPGCDSAAGLSLKGYHEAFGLCRKAFRPAPKRGMACRTCMGAAIALGPRRCRC